MKPLISLFILGLSTLLFAQPQSLHKRIKVISSEPIYEWVHTHDERCYDTYSHHNEHGNPVVGAVVGGVVGATVGHAVARRHHKPAAVIGGAVVGSLVGAHVTQERPYTRHAKCHKRKHKRLTGYNNIGYFQGVRIVKKSHKPLRRIPVEITLHY